LPSDAQVAVGALIGETRRPAAMLAFQRRLSDDDVLHAVALTGHELVAAEAGGSGNPSGPG
jgi:hypothetical protein